MSERSESHQRAIDQTAILYPYLEPAERINMYWQLQPCDLTELTINIPTFSERLAAAQAVHTERPTP